MSRAFGGRSFTTSSPTRTVPPVISSRPGDHAQRARLAAPGRADEDDELAVGDLEVELVDGPRAVGVDLRQPVELRWPPRPGTLLAPLRSCNAARRGLRVRPHMGAVAAAGGAGAAAPLRHGTSGVPRDAPDLACRARDRERSSACRSCSPRYLSFTDAQAGSLTGRWVGLENFRQRAPRPDLPRRALAHVPLHGASRRSS